MYTVPSGETGDLADGQAQIALPPGWTFVEEDSTAQPVAITFVPPTSGTIDTTPRMEISATTATVKWNGAPNSFTITLFVNVPSGRTSYTFVTKSKTNLPGDSLTMLDAQFGADSDDPRPAQPMINVGNIAEGEGTVAIAPGELYRGNPYNNFTITFTAKGPMYSDSDELTTVPEHEKAHILIQFPIDFTKELSRADLNLSVSSRGTLLPADDATLAYPTGGTPAASADNSIVIKVDGLNEDQNVVVSGRFSKFPVSATAMTKTAGPDGQVDVFTSSFRVYTSTSPLDDQKKIVWATTPSSELERYTIAQPPELYYSCVKRRNSY